MPPTMGECIDTEPRVERTLSPYLVYHLNPYLINIAPVLHDVCFFEGSVGKIKVFNRDIKSSNSLTVTDSGKEIQLSLADAGLLLATVLNSQAITTIRARRACFAISSQADALDDIVGRYADVMKASGVTKAELEKPLNILLMKCAQAARDAVEAFVRKVQETMAQNSKSYN